jgi:type II secretory pathway pseudopilin PulG
MLTQQDDNGVSARGQGKPDGRRAERGYALAVLLVSIAVMSILMSIAMPVWKTAIQREREEELIFRGEQYARAVGLFQRKFAGAFPPSVDLLIEQKFLRRKYKDPIVNGDFQVLYANSAAQPGQRPGIGTQPGATQPGATPGATPGRRPGGAGDAAFPGPPQGGLGGASALAGPRGGMVGVVSKSTDKSFRLYKGRGRYN